MADGSSNSSFVNGAAPLPLAQMTGYNPGTWFDAQCIATNGTGGAVADLWPYPFINGDAGLSGYTVLGFVDTRPHLKENLEFLMRSATLTRPFTYLSGIGTPFAMDFPSVDFPEEWYARPASPTNYEYSGYHTFSPNLNFSFLEEARPVRENFLWSNFVFNPSNYGQTGASYEDDCSPATFLRTLGSPLYVYAGSGTEANPSLALVNANAQWLFFRLIHPGFDCGFSQEVGIGTNSNNIKGSVNEIVISLDDYHWTQEKERICLETCGSHRLELLAENMTISLTDPCGYGWGLAGIQSQS